MSWCQKGGKDDLGGPGQVRTCRRRKQKLVPHLLACSAAPWQCWVSFAESGADGAVESWQMGQDGKRGQELAGWRRQLSGKSGMGTRSPPLPSSPSEAPRMLDNSQHGASHPHQQPPWTAWELQEVDIEQKQHWADRCLQCTQVFGPGLSGSPEGPKTPRWPCNRYQPGPESKGRPVLRPGLGSKETPYPLPPP